MSLRLTRDWQTIANNVGALSATLEKVPPFALSVSSTRHGSTSVNPTAPPSELADPVTFLPSKRGLPSAVTAWRRAPRA